MKMKTLRRILFLVALTAAPLTHGAVFIDDFANTNNITPQGNIDSSVNNNILTLTRTDPLDIALVDWQIGGTTRFSLDPVDQQNIVQITPSAPVSTGEWKASILFFDDLGTFIDFSDLIAFTNSTAPISSNITTLAADEGLTNADTYFVRIWLQGAANTGFEFSQFAAIPEPSHYAAIASLLVLGMVMLRRRRNR